MIRIGLGNTRVSNKGRVRNQKGLITRGSKSNSAKPYRIYRGQRIHILVMLFFGDNSPMWNEWYTQLESGHQRTILVCHNDSIKLDEEGYCNNEFANLRLDYQKGNILESHKTGTLSVTAAQKKRKREERTSHINSVKTGRTCRVIRRDVNTGKETVFESPHEASRSVNKKTRDIVRCCNGDRQTAHGFIWDWEINIERPTKKQRTT